mgnify:CR=1 FL=1
MVLVELLPMYYVKLPPGCGRIYGTSALCAGDKCSHCRLHDGKRLLFFKAVGGFDEELKVAFNDIDLCMKVRKYGVKIVFTPYAELYHYESKSRGMEDTPEKQSAFFQRSKLFPEKMGKESS